MPLLLFHTKPTSQIDSVPPVEADANHPLLGRCELVILHVVEVAAREARKVGVDGAGVGWSGSVTWVVATKVCKAMPPTPHRLRTYVGGDAWVSPWVRSLWNGPERA